MMDRRLAERRRRVAEDRARSNLGRLLRLLIVLAVVAAAVWFVQSPFMSVGTIEIRGADEVDVAAVLTRHGVVEDRPLVVVDVAGAEAALLEDPWVLDASVAREWPTTVIAEVVERTPAVAVHLSDGWWLAADDATLLEQAGNQPSGYPVAEFVQLSSEDSPDDLDFEGAVEFLAALPSPYDGGAAVRPGPEGLQAVVGGFDVRLGRPFNAAEKAAVTAAMLESGLEEGSILTVVAPANPAVLPPGADTEPEDADEDPEDSEAPEAADPPED